MPEYKIREANINDIDFIVKAIIEAEKSGSEIFSYSKIFNLKEEELNQIFHQMLLEEIEGCEFSISSYLVAEINNKIAGTIGAWIENKENPSTIIRGNLLSYFLPKSSLLFASQQAKIISELNIDHVIDALTFAIVYISPEHRGNHLFELLANEHIKRNKGVKELSIQLMANNVYAIKSYERYGFKKELEMKSDNLKLLEILPYNEKILMKKQLK